MRSYFLLILLFPAVAAQADEVRAWKDQLNREIRASLINVESGQVLLKLETGREVSFPLEKLSLADQKFLIAHHKKEPAKENEEVANFAMPWPERVSFKEDPEIKVVLEDSEAKRFIYESANYRYTSDVRLLGSLVKSFAVLFEATYQYCYALPLGLRSGLRVEGKFQIQLFEKFGSYTEAGGPVGSAGVFIGEKGVVLIPLDSLGVRPRGSSYGVDLAKSSSTVPHELTHQLTPEPYFSVGARGWFTEGIAEYVACTPYRTGGFNVKSNVDDIIAYVTDYGKKGTGGRALGTKIELSSLKDFMLQDYQNFMENGQLNYGAGLLITLYFLKMDGEGDGKRIKSYLQALLENKDGVKSLDLLLDGRTFPELEKEITAALKRKGVTFIFPEK